MRVIVASLSPQQPILVPSQQVLTPCHSLHTSSDKALYTLGLVVQSAKAAEPLTLFEKK
jgi:hypothetical protein